MKGLAGLYPGQTETGGLETSSSRALSEAQASGDSWFYFRSPPQQKIGWTWGERLGGCGRAFFSFEVPDMPLTSCHRRVMDSDVPQ